MAIHLDPVAVKSLADGMRALADRLDRARPAGDSRHQAGTLQRDCYRLWSAYISPETTTPEDRAKNTVTFQGREGTNDPADLLPEDRLRRADRILSEIAAAVGDTLADDAAKELRGVADELSAPVTTPPRTWIPFEAAFADAKVKARSRFRDTVRKHDALSDDGRSVDAKWFTGYLAKKQDDGRSKPDRESAKTVKTYQCPICHRKQPMIGPCKNPADCNGMIGPRDMVRT